MAYQGEPYVGDLALYYIAQKLESGQKSGSVKDAIGTRPDIGALDPINQFSENRKSTAITIADNLLNLPDKIKTDDAQKTLREMETNTTEIKNVEKVVEQFAGPNDITFDFAPNNYLS